MLERISLAGLYASVGLFFLSVLLIFATAAIRCFWREVDRYNLGGISWRMGRMALGSLGLFLLLYAISYVARA
ncbi:MAG TPA: hypothetical protein VG897_03415 [Terriglobales bacterium]|nr:hypothetical protein [Terriglobales bacterium]